MMRASSGAPGMIDLADARLLTEDVRRAADASVMDEHGAKVRIDATRAEPISVAAYEQAVVADCLERMAALARNRDERPLRERPRIEARLFAHVDGLVAAGATIAEVLSFWEGTRADDPWATWVAAFVLGSANGTRGLEAVAEIVNAIADEEDEGEAAILAAEGLLVAPHLDRVDLAREMMRSRAPSARVVGIDVLSRLEVLDAGDGVAAIDDANGAVRAAGLRALARGESLGEALPRVRACLRDEEPRVAWEAARALTLFGHRDAYEAVRSGEALVEALGWRAIEILVMAGAPEDLPVVERLARRLPMTPEVLSAVARFGHPAAWPYLVHGLGRAEIAEDAQRALVTTFGEVVGEGDEAEDAAAAWRDVLAGVEIPAGARWRRGEPWSKETVMAECASGELRRWEVEQRADELRARTEG